MSPCEVFQFSNPQLRLRCGRNVRQNLDISASSGPERTVEGNGGDEEIVLRNPVPGAGKGDTVIKAGFTEDAVAEFRQIIRCDEFSEILVKGTLDELGEILI